MDGEQDRDQENAQGKAEDDAVPGLIGLTQGGKADAQEQDEDHEGAEVETKPPHCMVPESSKGETSNDDLKSLRDSRKMPCSLHRCPPAPSSSTIMVVLSEHE